MVFQVEKSDRLEISGGTLEYIFKLSLKILQFSVASILVLLIGTLPAAAIGLIISSVAIGLYLIIVVLLAIRLGMVFLKYDIKIHGATISGTRSKSSKSQFLKIGFLSAGGLNLLIIVSIVAGTLAAIVAPPIIFMLVSFTVLVANELMRKQFDISISIVGVRITKGIFNRVIFTSARERRELSELTSVAEWVATSLTVFGQMKKPTI